jgi:acetylornithine/succinyldiaminopimelate/putrescine aminotransferase
MLEKIVRHGFDEFRQFVNPMIARRAGISGEPGTAVHVRAGQLFGDNGEFIEDFNGTQAFGHRNPHVTAKLQEFLASDLASWFPSRMSPFAGSLAMRLFERTGYDNAYFANSGSEAVESGLKLARAVTGKPRVLSIDYAYHGCTMGSVALMNDGPLRAPFAPHLPGVTQVKAGDVDGLALALRQGDVAGVIVEPIQIEGGVRSMPVTFVEALCELTANRIRANR